MKTDRQKVMAALWALDDRTPSDIVVVVARAAVSYMESELRILASLVGAKAESIDAIHDAVLILKRNASTTRQKTVLKRWEQAVQQQKATSKPKIRASRAKGGRR